jgi:hypothetical protein
MVGDLDWDDLGVGRAEVLSSRRVRGLSARVIGELVAYLGHTELTGLMDATEIRVRRPTKKRPGRKRFISGKSRQQCHESPDHQRRTRTCVLFGGASCPGSTADITQARQAGMVDWLDHTTSVEILTDAGYQGLNGQTFGQIITPTPKHQNKQLERMPGITELRDTQRKPHSRRRVRVDHTIAHLKN